MKINAKKVLGALGLMAAGGVLTLAELAREMTSKKHGQQNRDAMRLFCDAIENENLDAEYIGKGKVQFTTYKYGKPSE